MTDKKVLLVLFDEGHMSALYKAGFMPLKAFIYRDIYLWVDTQIKVRGLSEIQAIFQASDKFGKSEKTIRRALKSFE